MPNESIVQLPTTDITNPVTLRRVLSRMLDEINKLSSAELAVGSDLVGVLNKEFAYRDRKIAEVKEYTDKSLYDLQSLLSDILAIRAAALTMTATSTTTFTFNVQYNVVSVTKLGTGLYEFQLTQATVYNTPIIGNSTAALTWQIASSASSDTYSVNFAEIGTDKFQLQVTAVTQGPGATLVVAPYDLVAGDSLACTVFLNSPAAELPPK